MTYCNEMYASFPREPPSETTNVWSIGKTEIGLKIECNGVTVLHYNTSSCENSQRWGREIKKIKFGESDSASEQYRLISAQVKYCKELTVVTDSVSYERQPSGSVIRIRCGVGFENSGEEEITCRANGTWSSFPDCNKYNG
ncbi:uncharacterized protein LOC134814351 [Bolinopsis microptera]|uniref:uncharacterized protein LOC134814351 n=1 Tax=Bolinopsis microptera TaxID=2820187 RepID=UPI0030797194